MSTGLDLFPGGGMREVSDICAGIRRIFERAVVASGLDSTAGTCMYGSLLLHQSLEKFAGCQVRVRGGDGCADGGALALDGSWHGHYWVEGRTADGVEFVADITADQFGREPVVLLPLEAARDIYRPGDDEKVRGSAAECLADIMEVAHGTQ